ncbi:MAG TPA: ABC transporter ATP-binding protein, partial [Hyphomicrobiaceae bacterium]|nr:ABC transporter ATP-binding protein [Hyphomicrobiaceae bacterium]
MSTTAPGPNTASTTAPILEVTGLSVSLPKGSDRRFAIEDASFSVGRGEIVCVVGESGSGKSVTAQAIMGLLPKGQLAITAGSIRLLGEETAQNSQAEYRALRGTRMAMVFQEPMTALNPVERVGDQIAEVLEIHTPLSAGERRQRVLDIMRAVHLPDPEQMIDAYPHQLSGGQRQRIMIAAALILDPALLIADEPTTALDVTTQAQILKLVRELQERRGTGVLFITHDFGVVAEIADRVVVMQHGRIVEQGPRDDVLLRPREAYTRMLIASVPSLTPPAREPKTGDISLVTRALTKTYGAKGFFGGGRVVHAAADVNIEVRRGETLGIVGESGSGKSTVARCIARLIDPTSGELRVEGREIARVPESELRPYRRTIQIVFQDPYRSLNPRRTVGASIVEGPINFGQTPDAALQRARELMTLVGLRPDALDRYPHQFSGGQRQRICIARALAMEPKLLIADEAVSALDVSVQAQVLALLDDVRKRFDLAVLFITHDLRVAAQVCDRIAVMKSGRVVEHGATKDIFARPQHDYTKALFEAAPGRGFGTRGLAAATAALP